jgi:hypothetical protein
VRPLVVITLVAWPSFGQHCRVNPELINYAPIALQKRAQGAVTAKFTIGATGEASMNSSSAEDDSLVYPTRMAIEATKFPSGCSGEYTVIIEYRIREAISFERNRVLEVLGPTSYRLSIDTPHASIDTAPFTPMPWWRRLVRSIF